MKPSPFQVFRPDRKRDTASSAFRPLSAEEAERITPEQSEREERARKELLGYPQAVPLDVWEATFPADRKNIKKIAALKYRKGLSSQQAVLQAEAEHVRNQQLSQTLVQRRLERLKSCFGDASLTEGVERQMLEAASAVGLTAYSRGPLILKSFSPGQSLAQNRRKLLGAAWLNRLWRSQSGRCLLSGDPLRKDGIITLKALGDGEGADFVNQAYQPHLAAVARTFSQLVVLEALRRHREDRRRYQALEEETRIDAEAADNFLSWAEVFPEDVEEAREEEPVRTPYRITDQEEGLPDGGFADLID